MNRFPILFLGILLTFGSAWVGLTVIPHFQFGRLKPLVDHELDEVYPRPPSGLAQRGAEVYAGNGCIYCHSQQVRPEHQGSDIARGWGIRQTVPEDYLYDRTVYLGTMRTGPDLANVGNRLRDEQWHYEHLYAPRSKYPRSTMPAYRYLFRVQRIEGEPSADAVRVEGDHAPPEGYEVVPTADARALVAYLISLNRMHDIDELRDRIAAAERESENNAEE